LDSGGCRTGKRHAIGHAGIESQGVIVITLTEADMIRCVTELRVRVTSSGLLQQDGVPPLHEEVKR